MYIKELPYPFLGMALANQEIQNNKRDSEIELGVNRHNNGFNFKHTKEGTKFWLEVKAKNFKDPHIIQYFEKNNITVSIPKVEKPIDLDDLMNEINNL
jgi:hypothetical protein